MKFETPSKGAPEMNSDLL